MMSLFQRPPRAEQAPTNEAPEQPVNFRPFQRYVGAQEVQKRAMQKLNQPPPMARPGFTGGAGSVLPMNRMRQLMRRVAPGQAMQTTVARPMDRRVTPMPQQPEPFRSIAPFEPNFQR